MLEDGPDVAKLIVRKLDQGHRSPRFFKNFAIFNPYFQANNPFAGMGQAPAAAAPNQNRNQPVNLLD